MKTINTEIKLLIYVLGTLLLLFLISYWNNASVSFIVLIFLIIITLTCLILGIFNISRLERENEILKDYIIKNNSKHPESIIKEEINKKDKKALTKFTLYVMVTVTLSYIIYFVSGSSALDEAFQYLVNIATLCGIIVVLEDRSKTN
jgi:hypothetical protein